MPISARGRSPAARLAPPGHDLLLYTRTRPRQTTPAEAEPGRRRVELCLSQMAVLLLAVSLAGQLHRPLADGLADQVRAARCDHLVKRWVLHLTEDHLASVAYVFLAAQKRPAPPPRPTASPATPDHLPAHPTPRTAIPPSVPILHRSQTPTTHPGSRS
ncbi:DUF6417 family protein [Streptomyces sp. NBC_00582]|nr:DUF6417 family protein [Streptomyces sp. NBC_00582]WUB67701.1 DUF6417 family protein [Streptomyces sp. NBC_00582]